MDKKEKEIKFREITDKHLIKAAKAFEKREHVFKTVKRSVFPMLVICWILFVIDISFLLYWLLPIAITLAVISTVVLIDYYIYFNISIRKAEKDLEDYVEAVKEYV